MKKIVIITLIVLLASVSVGIILNPNEEDILHSQSKEETIALGLELTNVSHEAILEIVSKEDEDLLFFMKDGAIGIASISLKNNQWYWFRTGGLIGFGGSKETGYNDHGIGITTFNGNDYLATVGEIYDYNIDSMTINDVFEVKIVEYGNKRYWIGLLNDKDDYKNFRAFDINGEEIIEE